MREVGVESVQEIYDGLGSFIDIEKRQKQKNLSTAQFNLLEASTKCWRRISQPSEISVKQTHGIRWMVCQWMTACCGAYNFQHKILSALTKNVVA